jgi:ribosomal protein S27AE
MASPKCGHCGATTFSSEANTHQGIPTLYITCDRCGAVVGVVNNIKPQ